MKTDSEIEIVPGLVMTPFFKDEADYTRFRERFIAAVSPALEKARWASAMSEHEARSRLVR
jgi:hypothetical protein